MKSRIIIFITAFLFVLNFLIPTTVLSSGPPPAKKWKGEGEVLEFESIPVITVKDFLNGKVPEKTQTVWGTLNFPANAPDKNVPVVVVLHGGGGIHGSEEQWLSVFNSMGLATFMVDSNWPRRKCKKIFKKAIPNCNNIHKGITRIVDARRALELLSKHPRIDPARIGCIGSSLGGIGCLYQSVKRFQKMWGAPGLEFAASVPMYPVCNFKYVEDDIMSDEPIRIHIGDLDQYGSAESCVKYVERLRLKEKDITITIYPGVHHAFDAKITGKGGPQTTFKQKGRFFSQCNFEENTDSSVLNEENLGEGFQQILTQVGFNEWLASAEEKKIKKLFKYSKGGNKRGYANPTIVFDQSCVTKVGTNKYDKEAAEKVTGLVKEFFTTTLKK
ncbi:dienelactone hydrolase family protein [Candidatus Pelagibacter sp.]|jgi:dienelactone hydrolase|nr:dienelactone hydrolase family protein [Candidatus Pelagibacter sp.]|tara:strand:+ start:54 stop:1214 length:1161 start_codon:yes stop_codon:yes gene_type:complete